jgi:hypothetical protein
MNFSELDGLGSALCSGAGDLSPSKPRSLNILSCKVKIMNFITEVHCVVGRAGWWKNADSRVLHGGARL